MTLAEIKDLTTGKGFHPISVRPSGTEKPETPRFDGPLDDFWKAAKEIETRAVFIATHVFEESDLDGPASEQGNPGRVVQDDDLSNEAVTLEEMSPAISKYRKYLGKDCAFILRTKGGFAELEFLLTEPWWDQFHEDADSAIAAWNAKIDAEEAEADKEDERKNAERLKTLKSLLDDRGFCALKTQKAMLAYAVQKFSELEGMDEELLKREIQNLSARIDARRGLQRNS